jgi:hypothetical protein
MATRTTTKSNKVVSREELAASVPTANVSAVASELAPFFRNKGTFDMCRIAFAATVEGGLKGQDVADATTKAIADAIREDLLKAGVAKATADKAHADALTTSVAKGGAQVSRTAIVQRASAWSDVVEAGIVPTVPVIEVAYKITTTGGSGDARKAIIAAVKRETPAKRANSYIRRVTDALVVLRKGNRDNTAESAATASADDKAETVVEEVTLDGAEEIIAFIKATAARKWSDDDKALIVAALSEAIDTLS